jgi:hypothetical protein
MKHAALGFSQAFGLLDDGSVKAWSSHPPVEIRPASAAPAVVALRSAFTGSLAALFADGSLALLDASNQPVYAQEIADLPMGAAIRTLGGSEEIVCITLVAGGVRCASELPVGIQGAPSSYAAVAAGDEGPAACGLRDDGSVICFGGSQGWWATSTPPTSEPGRLVALDQPAEAIAGGQVDMCALLADGTVKCWSEAPSPGYGLSGITISSPSELRAGPWLPVDLGTRPGP